MSSGMRGQTQCPDCEVLINNSVIPEFCECGEYLGGNYTPPQPKITTCKISENIYSVIQNKSGPITRIFVDTEIKFCQSQKCGDKRGSLLSSGQSLQTFSCEHLNSCNQFIVPKTITIKLSEVKDLIPPDCYEHLSNYTRDGELDVHEIDDNFVVVNSFSPEKHELPTKFSHLKNRKCSLQTCKKKTRLHTLAFKDSKFCCHELVACVASNGAEGSSSVKTKKKTLQLNYEETSKRVLEDVINNFPKMHEFEKKTNFLKSEKLNLNKIRDLANSEDLIKEANLCSMCGRICKEYIHSKATNSYLVTLGEMERVKIPAFICENCNIIQYPKMCQFGFVNIHTKLILSFPFLMDICNELIIGSPIVECLERKLTLYGEKGELFGDKDEDYEESNVDNEIAEFYENQDFGGKQFEDEQAQLEFNPRSLAIKIEKFAIAIISSLITGESLDRVVCLICGSYPKIISTDGEVKESVAIQDNMVFENDGSPLPTLQEFILKLQVQVVSSSFFQHVPPLKVNMYQLPKNMAPRLTGVQQNSERKKKTQFGEVDTSNVDLHRMASLVRTGEFDGLNLGKYSVEELTELAKMCDVDVKNKTGTVIQNILKTSYERLLSGQSNCHKYTIAQRRTGGFQDAWCEHLFKVAASVQARQESVLDPVDIIHSLKTPPVLHICDDACTVVSNQLLTKPEIAVILYGRDRRGCFTPPIPGVKADASTTPNVEDILPLQHAGTKFDYSAVTDGGWRHPDTGKTDRFVMGHRLQMQSHRKDSCSNHVLDLCDSGRMVKSMNQEALNVKRKNTRVRQDRPRNFTTSFLFNYILDFIHNLEKFKKQRKQLGSDVRNEISWRVVLPAKQKNTGKTSHPKKRKRDQSSDGD